MAYTKTNWTNDVTELNAENMNHIEDGIYNSQNVELIAVSDEAPTSCVTGDKYYNTEDNLIYTATGTNTWGEDGEEPIQDVFYILFSEQSSYSYDGTTLVSVGGGTEDIVISDEEPTEEGVKIWIDTGEISQQASEITNSYSTSTGIGYSANYVNNLVIPQSYSLTEQPAHSAGTNNIYIDKIGNLVIMNILVYLNSLTANTWVNIGKLPNDIIPTTGNFYATGIVSNANDGSFVGFFKAEINNGYIRVKPQSGLGSLCSVQFNATYVL